MEPDQRGLPINYDGTTFYVVWALMLQYNRFLNSIDRRRSIDNDKKDKMFAIKRKLETMGPNSSEAETAFRQSLDYTEHHFGL